MSEAKKLFVMVDKLGCIFCNGADNAQQLAGERLVDRITHGKFRLVQVRAR